MFNFLLKKINNVQIHTQLLEACGWDDELLEETIDSFMESLNTFSGTSKEGILTHVRKKMRGNHSDEVVKLCLKLLESQIELEINNLKNEA